MKNLLLDVWEGLLLGYVPCRGVPYACFGAVLSTIYNVLVVLAGNVIYGKEWLGVQCVIVAKVVYGSKHLLHS